MKKGKVINTITNIILACFYTLLSLLGFLMLMGTEGAMNETNQLIIIWTYIVSYTGLFMFAICIGSMILSYFLYKKKYTVSSYIVKFIPVYICVFLLLIDFAVIKFI